MLQPGGILVYSTCSFTVSQNEAVVSWLLDEYTNAVVEPVLSHTGCSYPAARQPKAHSEPYISRHPSLKNAIRMSPLISGTSALFVARIRKAREV